MTTHDNNSPNAVSFTHNSSNGAGRTRLSFVRRNIPFNLICIMGIMTVSGCVMTLEDQLALEEEVNRTQQPLSAPTPGGGAAGLMCGPDHTHTLPNGDKVDIKHDWSNMGVANDFGVGSTSIDTNSRVDRQLARSERDMAANAGDDVCVFGAHGSDPDCPSMNGKTQIQSLPEGWDESICNAEYRVCERFLFSVCFGGQPGTDGYAATMDAFVDQCNVNPEDVIACTGAVRPGADSFECAGTLVDGNGTPIGNQTLGGVAVTEVPPTRGGELNDGWRCNSDCSDSGGDVGGAC